MKLRNILLLINSVWTVSFCFVCLLFLIPFLPRGRVIWSQDFPQGLAVLEYGLIRTFVKPPYLSRVWGVRVSIDWCITHVMLRDTHIKKDYLCLGLIFCVIAHGRFDCSHSRHKESIKHGPLILELPPWTRPNDWVNQNVDPHSWTRSMHPLFLLPLKLVVIKYIMSAFYACDIIKIAVCS